MSKRNHDFSLFISCNMMKHFAFRSSTVFKDSGSAGFTESTIEKAKPRHLYLDVKCQILTNRRMFQQMCSKILRHKTQANP